MMDDIIVKKYYTVGEVAKNLNLNASTIRFWESSFDWINPKRNKVDERRYTHEDINDVLEVAILMKVGGMTLNGVIKAHKMEYLKELKMFFITRQSNFRPEACRLLDFINYPYKFD